MPERRFFAESKQSPVLKCPDAEAISVRDLRIFRRVFKLELDAYDFLGESRPWMFDVEEDEEPHE